MTSQSRAVKGGATQAVRQYVERVASHDLEEFPDWNLEAPLPKLPVPELQDTLRKYLLSVQAIVSPEEYQSTRKIVQEFGKKGGEGEELQKKLEQFAEQKECWAYDMWLKDMYMKNPLCLPINSNPGMVFPHQLSNHFVDEREQLKFAAKLISGILDYKVVLDTRSLPIDRANTREKGQPMCMEQYYRLFPSYRIPGEQLDSLIQPGKDNNRQYVIVACKNQFYVLDVVLNGTRLSDENIYSQLRRIVSMAEDEVEEHNGSSSDGGGGGSGGGGSDVDGDGGGSRGGDVGILTSWHRPSWARARNKLMQFEENRKSLELIEQCIFILCLDRAIPISFNHQSSIDETSAHRRDEVSLASQMLHGLGSKVNSPNRWFDKTMQFIIGADGACGLSYEHSASEGIAVVQLIEHLLKYMAELQRRKLQRMQSILDLPCPTRLRWHVTDDIQQDIDQASHDLDNQIADLDMYVLRFEEFGKNFAKSHNMSPDAFIQLTLQLTYYSIHHTLVATYESASIRRFRQGRVDNIRACTPEALVFCKAVLRETEATDDEKVKLMRLAIKRQTEIMVETILGKGVDNHLLGLRVMAEADGKTLPEIFTDPTFVTSNNFTLSTSQVPTTMDAFMLYGPVVTDGYGVCYNPHPDYIIFAVTAFHREAKTVAEHFAKMLEKNLRMIKELCCVTTNDVNEPTIKTLKTNNNVEGEMVNGR